MRATLTIGVCAFLLAGCGNDDASGSVETATATDDSIERSAPRAADRPVELAQAEPGAQGGSGAVATQFQAGRDYERLTPTQPTSSPPEVVEVAEVFWYGCPHCYEIEAHMKAWKEDMPDGVNFVRIPATWNPLLVLHARAFYAAEALGKLDEIHLEFFREFHEKRNPLDTEDKLVDFFGRFGVSEDEFLKAFNSFSVNSKVQRAQQLAQRYRVSGVPMVVVNGKYTTDGGMARSYPRLLQIIDELVAMEKAGS